MNFTTANGPANGLPRIPYNKQVPQIPNPNYPIRPGQVYQDLDSRTQPRDILEVCRNGDDEAITAFQRGRQLSGQTIGVRCPTPRGGNVIDTLAKPQYVADQNEAFDKEDTAAMKFLGKSFPQQKTPIAPNQLPAGLENEIGENHNYTPLDQFNIKNILGLDILGDINLALTNTGLFIILSTILIIYLYVINNNYKKLVPNNMSASSESIYATVYGIVVGQINSKKGQEYFPLIFSLFIFILTNNLIGMVPYAFATTSHFILTFSLSFTIVLGATLLGLYIHQSKFFSLFVPSGCPLALLFLLVLIEFISYLSRPVSLGLRLAANVLSGHMLLNILGGFTYNIMRSGIVQFILGLLPFAFVIAFSGLEVGVAFIQAQVFIVLSCSYIKDGLDLH